MIITLQSLIAALVLSLIGGIGSEQLANRKLLKPTILLAILIAFAGALIGWWFFASVLNLLKDISLLDLPVIPALIGTILLLIPWFMVRAGYTSYGKKRTWQRKFKR
ncbi:MAG: hypothetical protein HXX20_06755 [Chloroflexi bacterium]|nr:hypothetical protein [Chloroflexota bacterium]